MESGLYCIRLSNRASDKAGILQGTLDLMVLQTVASMGPMHGYAVAERLAQVSSGALQLNMGTLYPALMRLEQRGLLRARWEITGSKRRARFYRITAGGRKRLAAERTEWTRMAGIIDKVPEGNA